MISKGRKTQPFFHIFSNALKVLSNITLRIYSTQLKSIEMFSYKNYFVVQSIVTIGLVYSRCDDCQPHSYITFTSY